MKPCEILVFDCRSYVKDNNNKIELCKYVSNKDQYSGGWVWDTRQGHGLMIYADGSVYDVSAFHSFNRYSISCYFVNILFSLTAALFT